MVIAEIKNPKLLASNTLWDWPETSLKEQSSSFTEESLSGEPIEENEWGFNPLFWLEITQTFSTVEELYERIQEISREVNDRKESYRSLSFSFSSPSTLELNLKSGVSGSYYLLDEKGNRQYVVKPLDEEAGCLHSKNFSTLSSDSPFRSSMPLYLSPMREVLAYQLAVEIGVGEIVPKTVFGILESDKFHDFSEHVTLVELKRYYEKVGATDREKLCSVQEYVPNAKSLFEAIHELEMGGLSDEEIANRFDQNDIEEACLLLWTTYDTDGHMGNFLVYPKGTDSIGNEILGLKKIDNGFAFPTKNRQLRNNLSYLPNARRELSERGKEKIRALDADQLAGRMNEFGLESGVEALRERIAVLQTAAKTPGITLKEINKILSKIGKKR